MADHFQTVVCLQRQQLRYVEYMYIAIVHIHRSIQQAEAVYLYFNECLGSILPHSTDIIKFLSMVASYFSITRSYHKAMKCACKMLSI